VAGATSPTVLASVTALHVKYSNGKVFFDNGTKIFQVAAP